MAASVTKTPLFVSGEIRWSDLRDQFKQSGSQISANELRRSLNLNDPNPIVPDATENVGVSTFTNWSASQMRNTIKTYDVTQTGTNDNNASLSAYGFNVGTQDWNANLGKNIKKRMIIDGIIGSSNINQYACYLNELAYNLRIEVNGSILGQGGLGAPQSGGSVGDYGGPAMYVRSTGGPVNVVVGGSAQIYGGGAGGSRGRNGDNGANSYCTTYYDYTTGGGCNYCPGCGGYQDLGCYSGGVCASGKGWAHYYYYNTCRVYYDYAVPGAPGGLGGAGGNGQGYNRTRTNSPLLGETDGPTSGTTGGCPTYGGSGYDGERGSDGVDWASSSSNTSAYNGAVGGRAITGENYIVTGSISNTTIKGYYQP